MLGILGNIKEYFWGSREHAIEFLGTRELNKSEFKGTSTYFWGTREKLQFFLENKGTCTPLPPPPGRPSLNALPSDP